MYPIDLRLEGRAALVAGGGAVAHRKVAGLLAAGAAVTVVAPELVPPLAALAADVRDRRSCGERRLRQGGERGWRSRQRCDDARALRLLPAGGFARRRSPRHGIDGRRIARTRPHAEEAARRPYGRKLGRLAQKARQTARGSEGTHRGKCRTRGVLARGSFGAYFESCRRKQTG